MTEQTERQRLPAGFRVVLDPDTRVLHDGRTLTGGQPLRAMRLSEAGARAFAELTSGSVRTDAAAQVAQRLLAAGMAHPRPPQVPFAGRVAVVVPVRDRPADLDRCLSALGTSHEVIVVDDRSDDRESIAKVAARHGAQVVPRALNGGPAAARNTALREALDAELVAFLDSDCVPPTGWPQALLPHFADPAVGAVAPRVVPLVADGRASARERYAEARSPLDLGEQEALVQPGARVPYVPSAALLVRSQALAEISFDESLRYGEDVDLVWRLIDAGWRVRYEPSVQVRHFEPTTWPGLLRRRFLYGTSAGPLAERHPDRLAPLVLQPWPTLISALALSRRPVLAGLAGAVATAHLTRRLDGMATYRSDALRLTAKAVTSTTLGIGRATTQLALPLAIAGCALAPGRRGQRLAVLAALISAPPIREWIERRPDLDPLRWTAASIADDVAYGAGVWRGAIATRTLGPLRPRITRSPNRR